MKINSAVDLDTISACWRGVFVSAAYKNQRRHGDLRSSCRGRWHFRDPGKTHRPARPGSVLDPNWLHRLLPARTAGRCTHARGRAGGVYPDDPAARQGAGRRAGKGDTPGRFRPGRSSTQRSFWSITGEKISPAQQSWRPSRLSPTSPILPASISSCCATAATSIPNASRNISLAAVTGPCTTL